MAEKKPQTFANHTRFDPWFHFFLLPVFGLLLILSIIHFIAHITEGGLRDQFHAVLLIVLALAFLVAVFKIRLYSLKVQDRVIRLEERLRYERVLPADLMARAGELSLDQILALRFASDAELPGLTRRVLQEQLADRKAIKLLVTDWRADHLRA